MTTGAPSWAERFAEILRQSKNVEEMPHDSAEYANVKTVESLFTASVHLLRSQFPDPNIRRLMSIVWDLVKHRVVESALGPVATPSFTVVRAGDATRALILLPVEWVRRIEEDPVMQTGALIFLGSQAVDYWNGRISPPGKVQIRARAYEAEFLLKYKAANPEWEPNDYQQRVLQHFPQGLESTPMLLCKYDPKPYAAA
jgi:hypothetical protein